MKKKTPKNRKPYECSNCEGSGMTQSENGDKAIKCTKCEGTGVFNPYS